MKFNKIKKLLKKDEKELESNPLNDIYHALAPEERSEKKEIEEKEGHNSHPIGRHGIHSSGGEVRGKDCKH